MVTREPERAGCERLAGTFENCSKWFGQGKAPTAKRFGRETTAEDLEHSNCLPEAIG